MSERLAIDYAWSHPDPKTIKAKGYEAVLRYLSHTPSKNLSADEAAALHAVGLSIGLVWETTANRAGQGFAAGQFDAEAAEWQADNLGYPKTAVLFYAVDFDATPQQVTAYFDGVKSKAKRPVGVYGGINVVNGINVPYAWQTLAWSHGKVSPRAHIYQRGSGSQYDIDVLLKPLPLWDAVAPTPKPVPVKVTRGKVVDQMLALGRKVKGGKGRLAKVRQALRVLRSIRPLGKKVK